MLSLFSLVGLTQAGVTWEEGPQLRKGLHQIGFASLWGIFLIID